MNVADAEWLERHSRLLMDSYRKLTGKSLIETAAEGRASDVLYEAPFALLSHGTEEDPVLNYGNRTAQTLWEMDWQTFTRMPSRLTAEPMQREVREAFMEDVRQKGYSDGYEGVRVSGGGGRFRIERAVVWNLIDEKGAYRGQAAMFPSWTWL
ncbi:MEKHLA domain-containing protein [Cohnella rhizosphaerae]|uniref:MEKHLA domain-containing protein n=1 Tax=Cohnella rhizosphaerae TaxID=1457232 RepID=A0A9X4KQB2_9BACL|nr:MEKHLA domain-containing protein [Cohnella rhizosphaerae]MDG0808568.1 MEKHLA domain-containing protein [Cohnella rhizosphaerae]